MKSRHLLLSLIFIVAGFTLNAASPKKSEAKEIEAITQLVNRIIPGNAQNFEFRIIPQDKKKDTYSIEDINGKILICGNNANSLAVALNYYLNNYCNASVSWYAEVPVVMPETMPKVGSKITSTARVNRRFFLNYCTYGYTMPYWDWKQWERIIDWMALNGINMPLAITGQEAVWFNVLQQLGMTPDEIRSYFVGPTYLPWHRMANIDRWNGPLPQEWLDKQVELQKKILERERQLNMRPVLPAFAGHVPARLKELYPDANIKYLGTWAGFKDEYRCHFLNPEEKLFAKIQKLFLEEQTRLFGTDHIYGVDPFNEVDPPSWEPDYLNKVSRNMYRTLTAVDSKAEWMQMSWMFYHDRKDWTLPRVKALLSGVPTGKMSLLDYHCENVEIWQNTDKFYGQPYIWCYLGNFGGNTTITGNVKESGARLDNALANGGKNMLGIGSTLEGLDVVQFPYEYIFAKAWSNSQKDETWINHLADRHYGEPNENVRKAWDILFNDVYVQVPRTLGILPNYRPALINNDKRIGINYDNNKLIEAWSLLLNIEKASTNDIQIDLITVGRQVLGNYFTKVKNRFDSAYYKQDANAMRYNAEILHSLLSDIDALNSFNYRCTIEPWIQEARNYATTPEIADYYEKNARNLITTWGGKLNDYASRTWAGLINDYYAKRWEVYTSTLIDAVQNYATLDAQEMKTKMEAVENNWVNSTAKIETVKRYDILSFSRMIYNKYRNDF